jgi:hypothetical protein
MIEVDAGLADDRERKTGERDQAVRGLMDPDNLPQAGRAVCGTLCH